MKLSFISFLVAAASAADPNQALADAFPTDCAADATACGEDSCCTFDPAGESRCMTADDTADAVEGAGTYQDADYTDQAYTCVAAVPADGGGDGAEGAKYVGVAVAALSITAFM